MGGYSQAYLEINQNIGCIETKIGDDNTTYVDLINQNIGCIET